MKIGVVNDVSAILKILTRVINEHTEHQVAWTAQDGAAAVEKCAAERPDIVLMDLIMPVMDGIEATRRIMDQSPCAVLVVTASVTINAAKVFEAMAAGALDAISTPTLAGAQAKSSIDALQRKLTTIGKLITRHTPPLAPTPAPKPATAGRQFPLVAIGSSTGGPGALATLLSELPHSLPAAIVVVQHVDSQFAPGLAQWLNDQTALPVRLAADGDRPEPGTVLLAGTSDHLILSPNRQLTYTAHPKDYVYRPSVDVFFDSVAAHWPCDPIGVLLTGMGRDGASGLLALQRAGRYTIAQDRASCAVYGMPKAAVELGAACEVLPIDSIAGALRARILQADEKQPAQGAAQ